MRKIVKSDTAPFNNVISIINDGNEIYELHENVNDILLRKDNQYFGWECWAGVESLLIDSKGDVYIASCKQRKLGNIQTGFTMPTEPTICASNWCACAASLNITKTQKVEFRKYLKKFSND